MGRAVLGLVIFSVTSHLVLGLPFLKQNNRVAARHPDIDRNARQLIQDRGYPVEEHYVTTKDGYILTLHRIPHGRSHQRNTLAGPKPVAFLQHGLLMDSTNWILNSANDSLGYILADEGFDVWLGNIRGNVYSQRHKAMDKNHPNFWDFSWQDMAEIDLSAMIDHVLNITVQKQVFYVGHSQGTLIGFTGFSSNRTLAKSIKTFFALAPVYTVAHCSDIVKGAAYALFPVEHGLQNHVSEEFDPGRFVRMLSDSGFCGGLNSEEFCYKAGEALFGFDSTNLNMSRVPVIVAHWGSGTSFKNMVHFGQMVVSGKCQKYDYGFWNNYWHKYGQFTPPKYEVEKLTTPTVLYSGSHDKLASPLDVYNLKQRIQHVTVHAEEIQGWNHADFLFGMDAPQRLYSDIITRMKVRECCDKVCHGSCSAALCRARCNPTNIPPVAL